MSMKSMKRLIAGVICTLLSSYIYGAIDTSTPFYMQEVLGRVSPQTAGIMHIQSAEAGYFTGALELEIPIFTINDPDFNIPISMHYTADGFRPRQHSEFCGLNWTLNAGGCISRKVQGQPDDYMVKRVNTTDSENHFIETAGFLYNPHVSDTSTIMNGYAQHINGGYSYDYLPDVYTFSFCGHGGSFIIDNNHQAQIISGDFVDVDLSNLGYVPGTYTMNQELNRGVPPCQKIVITTLDGYKYTFGGNSASIEFTKNLDPFVIQGAIHPSIPYLEADIPPVTSWYLTRITAPNGRNVSFNYVYYDYLWQYDEFYVNPDLQDVNNFCYGCNYSASATRQIVLSSITLEGLSVSFSSDLTTNILNHSARTDEQNSFSSISLLQMAQLKRIVVRAGERILRNVRLAYETVHSTDASNNSSYRYLLSSINIDDIGGYNMQYDLSSGNAPALGHPQSNYYVAENVDSRGYIGGENIKWGSLSRITYPTGGYQTFLYDTAHYYDTEYYYYFNRFNNVHNTLAYISESPQTNHHRGLRINTINDYNQDGSLLESKVYTYSQGVFYDDMEHTDDPELHYPRQFGWQYNPGSRFGYGKVTETSTYYSENVALPVRQKIVYEFHTDNSHVCRNSDLILGITNGATTYAFSGLAFSKSELASKIGKQTKKQIYRVEGSTEILKSEECYSWSGDNGRSSAARVKIAVFEKTPAHVARRLYITPVRLSYTTTYDYSGSTSYTTAQYFSYDNKNRIIKKEYCNIAPYPREFHFEKYIYPDNICSRNSFNGYTDGVQYLVYTNQISKPIEKLSGYVQNNTYYLTSGQLITPVLTHPSGVWTLTNSVYQLALGEPINESSFTHISHPAVHQLSFDNRYQLLSTYTQNQNLQITSSTSIGDMTTFYTWNGIYLSSSRIGGHQTNYEVIPYVGVSKITDPRGLSTCYSYDEQGRVTEEYLLINGEKQIIKAYNYHYSNQ